MSAEQRPTTWVDRIPFANRFLHRNPNVMSPNRNPVRVVDRLDRFVASATSELNSLGLVGIGTNLELLLTEKYNRADHTVTRPMPVYGGYMMISFNNVEFRIRGKSPVPNTLSVSWDEMGYSARVHREITIDTTTRTRASEFRYSKAVYDRDEQLLAEPKVVFRGADELTWDDRNRLDVILKIMKETKSRDIK